jgi:hypothetical protein
MTRRTGRLVLFAVAMTGSVIGGELVIRTLRPQATYSMLRNRVDAYFTASDFNTFTLRPNYKGTEISQEHPGQTVTVTINSIGLRGPELRPAQPNQILVLGDSYTFGEFVNDQNTYPAQLQALLDHRGYQAQVLNAGYADGFETDQHYVWFRHLGPTFHPTVTLLGFFVGNDIHFLDFSAWQDLDESGLPTRYRSTNLFVDPWGRILTHNPDGAGGTVGVEWFYRIPILRESQAFVFAGIRLSRLLSHENVAAFWDNAFAHIFGDFTPEFLVKETAAVNLIDGIRRQAHAAGSEFAVVLIPINFMVDPEKLPKVVGGSRYKKPKSDYYARLAGLLAARGISSINIGELMRASSEGPFFPANGEVHFNTNGHRFTAQRIVDFLTSQHMLHP